MKLPQHKFVYFTGSRDLEEDKVTLRQITQMITQDYIVVMKNLDTIYGSLYDLLNQKYENIDGKNFCYIVDDSYSEKVSVHKSFKCIVLMSEYDQHGVSEDDRLKR